VTLWLSVRIGAFVASKHRPGQEERDDLSLVVNASLTLLALIIGFSFSMAVSRYDQRKNYEEEEANAIGTEYARADLLTTADAARVRQLLIRYLDQRLLFYTIRDAAQLAQVDAETARLQKEMWQIVQNAATERPTPPVGLVVMGMNDVLNRQDTRRPPGGTAFPVGPGA